MSPPTLIYRRSRCFIVIVVVGDATIAAAFKELVHRHVDGDIPFHLNTAVNTDSDHLSTSSSSSSSATATATTTSIGTVETVTHLNSHHRNNSLSLPPRSRRLKVVFAMRPGPLRLITNFPAVQACIINTGVVDEEWFVRHIVLLGAFPLIKSSPSLLLISPSHHYFSLYTLINHSLVSRFTIISL